MLSEFRFAIATLAGLLLVPYNQPAFGQNPEIDSLQNVVKTTPDDSLRSLIFIELAFHYSGYDTAKAKQNLQEADRLIRAKNWNYNRGYYYECISNYTYERGLYEKSLVLADSALVFFELAEKSIHAATRDAAAFQLAETIMGKGATYSAMGKSEEAIEKYQESLHLFELAKSPLKSRKIATVYNNIATVFFLANQYEKGLEYDLKSIPYHIAAKNDEMVAYAYTYVGADFMRLKKFDSAKIYFDKAEPIVKRFNKSAINIEYYGKIGEWYWHKKDWPGTRKYYTIAYENASRINNVYSEVEYSWGIANCFYNEGNYTEAAKYLKKAQELAERNDMQGSQRGMYATTAYNYYKLGDYRRAYDYLLYFKRLEDSVASVTMQQKIAEMDERFQSGKKQEEIVQLQKERKSQNISLNRKSLFNYILAGSVLVSVIVGFLLYRNLRARHMLVKQQEQMQQQRIRVLEKDRQLVAVDSMIKGQEEERSRLAKDLHDGLGGMLSGVKFSLINMKDNLIVTPDNMAVFERSLDMIDTSIRELRRVAHNMMPEMLARFGLDEALKEYCNSVNATKLVTAKYQSFGMDKRLDASPEIIIYRIIQELANNILKHAPGSDVLIQLIKEDNRFSVLVEDNGIGFDPAGLDQSKGAGWGNIRSRVEYLKGRLELVSAPGKGTSVTIEFNL